MVNKFKGISFFEQIQQSQGLGAPTDVMTAIYARIDIDNKGEQGL